MAVFTCANSSSIEPISATSDHLPEEFAWRGGGLDTQPAIICQKIPRAVVAWTRQSLGK
jgi:hypothetical protein